MEANLSWAIETLVCQYLCRSNVQTGTEREVGRFSEKILASFGRLLARPPSDSDTCITS